jgi:hypothetical protein
VVASINHPAPYGNYRDPGIVPNPPLEFPGVDTAFDPSGVTPAPGRFYLSQTYRITHATWANCAPLASRSYLLEYTSLTGSQSDGQLRIVEDTSPRPAPTETR